MAHPYSKHNEMDVAHKRVGKICKAEGGSVEPLPIAQEGPLQKLGLRVYRRELGRDMKSGKFGVNPYPKTPPGSVE